MSPLAYLHGFASSPLARKGQALRRALEERMIALELPDLNRPSFPELTVTGALDALDDLAGKQRGQPSDWSFVGSSFGGYLAALWAARNPSRARRLLLLCPGFDLASRWKDLAGPEAMADWEERGVLEVEGPGGELAKLHWDFYRDFGSYPAFPPAVCPTLVIHGLRDEVVPIATSRRWAEQQEGVQLVEVDDDHGLHGSMDRITECVLEFLVGPSLA